MVVRAAYDELLSAASLGVVHLHNLKAVDDSFVSMDEPAINDLIGGEVNSELKVSEVPHFHAPGRVSGHEVVVFFSRGD